MFIKSTNVYYLTGTVTLGSLLFGYDTAVISGALDSIRINFNLSKLELGLAASAALFGCVIGAWIGRCMSLAHGKRSALMLAAVLVLLSTMGSSVAPNYYLFILFRCLGGVGIGIISLISPLYIAEIAPSQSRGRFVSSTQLAIGVGMLLAYTVNYGILSWGSEYWLHIEGWRYMFACEIVPATLFLSLLFTIDEPKAWDQNKDPAVTKFMKPLIVELYQDKHMFKNYKLILGVGIILSVIPQLAGINVFLYFLPNLMRDFSQDLEMHSALFLTLMLGIANLIATLFAMYFVDKLGRKPLLIIGGLVMSLSMLLLAAAARMDILEHLHLYILILYISAFAFSLGPITWVLLAEIFPQKVRLNFLSIAVMAQWFANFSISFLFLFFNNQKANSILVDQYNGVIFIFFGVVSLLAISFFYMYIPETKGKTFEEIEAQW